MMATSVTFEVKGLRELGERMRALGNDMALKIARQATGAAAQVIKKQAKANITRNSSKNNTSIDTGALLNNVIVKRIKSDLTSEHIVTIRRKKIRYAHLVEYGSTKMPAESFLRTGFDAKKEAAKDAMVDKLKKAIDKAGRK